MTQRRERLRATFDEAALLYDRVRPGYPEELFDDIVSWARLPAQGRILEIGCGTGQATLPMARRGYGILCVELGAQMAEVARRNLAAYPQVEIAVGAFEQWPLEEAVFDLVLSATAFHWVDPEVGYQKMARALKPGGSIALFWHVHVQNEASHRFFEEAQEVYRREVPEKAKNDNPLVWPQEVGEPVRTDIERSGLFGEVTVRRYRWDITYDADSYINLLDTYSDHRALEAAKRERLYQGLRNLIETRFGGRITKGYMAVLYMAKRK